MRAAGVGPLALAKPVFALAAIAAIVLLSMSAYFLPASNREFKDLQFEIRNRFVASLLQEGTFTTISDQLTIYIGGRDQRGEVTGLLVNDERDRAKPVTITAERGAFAESGRRLADRHGQRQPPAIRPGDRQIVAADLRAVHARPRPDARHAVVRFPEAQERYLGELFFPPPGLDRLMLQAFTLEAHQRLLVPLSAFSFAIIPLACLLPGELNRRGQFAAGAAGDRPAFLFQSLDLAVRNLWRGTGRAIPLMYLTDLLPLALGFGILLRGGIRLGFRRPAMPTFATR